MIGIEFHNYNAQNVVCSIVDRATEIRNDVLEEQLKFLEEWLEKPRYDDKDDSLVVEEEIKKVDYLVAAIEVDLTEEIITALKEEQNEKNQYGSQYDNLYNVEKMFECVGENPIEDEEEFIEDDIGNNEFDLKE